MTALDLAERAARRALDRRAPGCSGTSRQVSVVNIMSPVGSPPAADWPGGSDCRASARETTTVGGNTPQRLVNRAASAIAAGEP